MRPRRRWLRAIDIRIGVCYASRISDRPAIVKISALESPGIWSAINQRTGKPTYVQLRDLIRPAGCPEDWRKIAAGDVD